MEQVDSEHGEEIRSKLTDRLLNYLGQVAAPDEVVEVVVELTRKDLEPLEGVFANREAAKQARTAWAEASRALFSQRAEPATRRIIAIGGSVVDEYFLNSTFSGNVPADIRALEFVAEEETVERIDLPARLYLEEDKDS